MTDPLSDMLTRVRNALLVKQESVVIPYSTLKFEVAKILEQEGYIKGFSKDRQEQRDMLVLDLKYYNGESVIRGIETVSKPGQRIYKKAQEFPLVLGGLGTLVVSTPQGVMTTWEARKRNIGGEVLVKIW
ncbi:30S ribosomal protein S8 [Patescibacteria group bacterium]|nr:MAG: 30S ribosomal protein S8 [Patescibacteria group bacterium]